MKKLLFLLLLCSTISTIYSNATPIAKEQSEKQMNSSDTLNVRASIVYPVKISFSTLDGTGSDDIEIKIVNKDSLTSSISHFTKHVTAQADTTIFLGNDYYWLVWLNGGALLHNPKLSGANVSVSGLGWMQTDFPELPFKVYGQPIGCEGKVTLNAGIYYTGSGRLKYKWSPATGLNNDTIPNPTATVGSDITYTVTVTALTGQTATSDINVTVDPLSANAGVDQTIICGGIVPLNSVSTNYTGTGKLKYKWTPATGLNNDTIPNPIATVASDITYTVTVTAPTGCVATSNVKVVVAPLSVNAGADKAAVYGGSVQFGRVTANYYGAGLKYKWTPSTGLNNDTIANPVCTVTGNITYTVTVSTLASCTASDNVAVSTLPMVRPQIGIVSVSSSNKNMIVWNKPVSTGIKSYNIYKETNISNAFEKIGTVSYDSLSVFVDTLSAPNVKSSKYELSISDRSDLETPLSDPHKTMHLSINKGMNNTWNLIWEPYLGFNVATYNIYKGTNANNLNFLDATSGSSSQYTDTSVSSGDVYYQLEVISPTFISPSKAPASFQKTKESEGSLNSILGSYNSSRSNIANNAINGIPVVEGEINNIKLYPNPVTNELKIDFEGGTTFEILNLMGQVVYIGNLMESNIVQTSNLTSGIYLIKFKTGKTFEYMKIIKE